MVGDDVYLSIRPWFMGEVWCLPVHPSMVYGWGMMFTCPSVDGSWLGYDVYLSIRPWFMGEVWCLPVHTSMVYGWGMMFTCPSVHGLWVRYDVYQSIRPWLYDVYLSIRPWFMSEVWCLPVHPSMVYGWGMMFTCPSVHGCMMFTSTHVHGLWVRYDVFLFFIFAQLSMSSPNGTSSSLIWHSTLKREILALSGELR